MSRYDAPRLRAEMAAVPDYVPGRSPRRDCENLKLSSNENPYPPLPSVLAAVREQAGRINRYPDPGCTALAEALAARLDVPADRLVFGTGSVAVGRLLVRATAGPGDEVLYAWRSFEAYPIMAEVCGATSVRVPLRPDEGHDLDAMADAVTDRTRIVFLCTPNNPTGTVVRRAELERFLECVPSDVLVVLDEAYTEFVRDPEAADGLDFQRRHGNVVVLRTFSKAYGLAGLRIGYAVAHPGVAAVLRKVGLPFGVSQLAQDAATASLAAEEELLARVELLVKERARVTGALRESGFTPPDSEANFVWLRLGDRTAEFTAACAGLGAFVRPYGADGVRITVGEPEANDVVLRAAAAWRH
ncbi:histidinol-phosphate transaminase [Kitasatospora sp. NPDC085879]|uniref:histidinol-phosphate transaminase n=1 Tax=Kitasatospora sp. NPDC085879 TaxID=3154769 RepID=UPI00342A276E